MEMAVRKPQELIPPLKQRLSWQKMAESFFFFLTLEANQTLKATR